jgi:hypothetical protein
MSVIAAPIIHEVEVLDKAEVLESPQPTEPRNSVHPGVDGGARPVPGRSASAGRGFKDVARPRLLSRINAVDLPAKHAKHAKQWAPDLIGGAAAASPIGDHPTQSQILDLLLFSRVWRV